MASALGDIQAYGQMLLHSFMHHVHEIPDPGEDPLDSVKRLNVIMIERGIPTASPPEQIDEAIKLAEKLENRHNS